jgi:nucleoside 2-deoxyribosyltransferase
VRARISGARLVVADLTSANPNVYLEVGYAWGKGVPTVLIAKSEDALKFDVRSHRCIVYSSIKDLEDKLTRELHGLLTADA